MKKIVLTTLLGLITVMSSAQQEAKAFHAYLYNNEYEVYLRIDFYNESIIVPGNELYGKLPGYLGKKNNSFCWPVTAATLIRENDTLYTLKQGKGSTLKVPKNGKWQKLPKTLPFVRKQ